jgi:DNA-binding transcriptional MerR regulator
LKIGELAQRANVSTRLLRYYEEQGLLAPGRAANGYRDYPEQLVDRVLQIRGLLDAGIPTRIIRQILPCLSEPRELHFADATPEMLVILEQERDALDGRIRCLIRNRDAISSYLEALRTLSTGYCDLLSGSADDDERERSATSPTQSAQGSQR